MKRTLKIDREIVRHLTDRNLLHVVGGDPPLHTVNEVTCASAPCATYNDLSCTSQLPGCTTGTR